MEQVINVIAPTFFAIMLGFLFARLGSPHVETLIDAGMFIATPCLVVYSLYSSPIVLGEAALLWAACLLVMAGTFVIAWLTLGVGRKRSSGVYLPIVWANLINIPVPIIYLAFGDEGVALAILFSIPSGLLMYSLGIYLASGHTELKQGLRAMLRTPLIYAAVLGLALNLAGVRLPEAITNSLQFVGQAAVPLMLLVMGMSVGDVRFAQVPLTLVASVIRMGGGLAIGFLAVWLLGLTGLPRAIVLFEAAMPGAIVVSVLSSKYKNEPELVSSIVLTTTIMAVGVVPGLVYYLT